MREIRTLLADGGEPVSQPLLAAGNVAVLYCLPHRDSNGPWMTLILAICADSGIVLVADSRVSVLENGSLLRQSDEKRKLHPFGLFGVGVAGFEPMGTDIIDSLRERDVLASPLGRVTPPRGIDEAKQVVGQFLHSRSAQYFSNAPPETWPNIGLLLAGYASDGVTPGIYVFFSKQGFYGAESHSRCIGSPGACTYTRVVTDLLLDRRGDRPSLEEAKALGVMTVRAAEELDLTVGGATQMAVITPTEYADVSDEVPMYRGSFEHLKPSLREAFWKLMRRHLP